MFGNLSKRNGSKAAPLAVSFVSSVVMLLMFSALPLQGATYSWTVSSGDWSTASNWGGTLPTLADTGYIANAGTANVTQLGATAGTLSLDGSGGGGTVLISTGRLSTNLEYGGNAGIGSFVQSGGTNTLSSSPGVLYLGYASSAAGSYSLSNGLLSTSYEYIGLYGTGAFTQTGGQHLAPNGMYLGSAAGGYGSYNLSGGTVSDGNYGIIGPSGTGSFTQSGGVFSLYNASQPDHSLILASGTAAMGTYSLSGGSLSASSEIIGGTGIGSITQSGGTNTVNVMRVDYMVLGYTSGGTGTYNLSGTGLLISTPPESIGYYGNGSFTQSGGTNSAAGGLVLAQYGGSTGIYNLNGGLLRLSGLSRGSGNGTFNFGGGTLGAIAPWSSSLSINLSSASGTAAIDTGGGDIVLSGNLTGGGGLAKIGSGSLTLTGVNNYGGDTIIDGGTVQIPSGSLASPNAYVGNSRLGYLAQSGGTVALAGASGVLYLGYVSSAAGSYSLSGGLLSTSYEYVGLYGTGAFTQTGGRHLAPNGMYLGSAAGGYGSYNLSEGSLSDGNYGIIGYGGTGSFMQSGGVFSLYAAAGDHALILGGNSGASGSYNLSGGSLSSPSESIGGLGVGTFTQSGGTNTVYNPHYDYFTLGYSPSSSGAYSLSGSGLLTVTPPEAIGFMGSGTFTQTGGTNSASGGLVLAQYGGSTGTYNLNGGLLRVSSLSGGGGSASFNFGNGTLQALSSFSTTLPIALSTPGNNDVFDTMGNSLTLNGALYGPGGLRKVGAGTLVLAASNSYTGSTLVSGGTLVLLADGPSSSFTANNGGTLEFNAATMNLGTRYVRAATSGNVKYLGATINGGFLRGPGTHSLLAGLNNSLNTCTIDPATVVQQAGNDTFTNVINRGQVANNSYLTISGGNNDGGSSLTVNGTADVSEWINAGVITVTSGGRLNNHVSNLTNYGGARVTVNSGGTLNADSQNEGVTLDLQDSLLVNNGRVTGTTNVYYGATVSGSGSFGSVINLLQGGALAIAPGASPTGTSLCVSGGSITGSGSLALSGTVHGAALVALNPTDNLVLSGNLGGDGSITKLGAGTVVLSGSNGYLGGTTVVAGTLIVAGPNAIADGTSLTVGDGTPFASRVVPTPLVAGFPTEPATAIITPVPEPGTLALMAAVVVMLAIYCKRR